MTSLILDASVALDLVVDQGHRTDAATGAVAGQELFAPSLIDLEVVSALARMERAGALTSTQGARAVDAWDKVRVTRCSDVLLLRDAWLLRQSMRVADAFYVALAQVLGAPLVTSDARMARAPHPGVAVTLVG